MEEGRRVYDDPVKALAFVLPSGAGRAPLIMLGAVFFSVVGGVPLLPVGPAQVLGVNLVVAAVLALPLAFEALEPGAMRRPPRDPHAPILDPSLILRTTVASPASRPVWVGRPPETRRQRACRSRPFTIERG